MRKSPSKVWQYPASVERGYVSALTALSDELAAAIYKAIEPRLSALAEGVRLDDWADDFTTMLEQALAASLAVTETERVAAIVRKWAKSAQAFNAVQLHSALVARYGVDIFKAEPWLLAELKAWEATNLALIKSLPTSTVSTLRSTITDALQSGKSFKQLRDIVRTATGAQKTRAELIARDQLGKLNGRLTVLRQQSVGAREFIWRTVRDERVRHRHTEYDGERYEYDNPPSDGLPGQPIRCRCWAEAVFPDLEDLI